MGLFKKRQKNIRKVNSSQGRSLSSNSYYRPAKARLQKNKNNEVADSRETRQNTPEAKKRSFTVSSVINALLLFVFLILLFFATTLSSKPEITIAENSFQYRNEADYEAKAKELLTSNILNQSKLLFRSSDFEQSMIESFPEIATVKAIVPLGGRDLVVSIELSEPLANIINGAENGVVDTLGLLVGSDEQNELYSIRFASPQDNFSEGSRLLTATEVELLRLVESEFQNVNLSAAPSMEIEEVLFNVSQGQFEVRFKDTEYFLKLSTYANPREQVGGAIATLRELDNVNQLPSKYIDVRVPGRVFVN